MNYRSEIDGLRAVAVLPVIFFHGKLSLFSGGFVGVDIFFVISGYLITSIIYQEISCKNFSIIKFYERRARRILPALFFVKIFCVIAALLWLLPDEYRDFSQSLIAVNLFSSNFLFWQESGYFESAAELKPLLHTWSLAVEEQFYLFFPLALLLLVRFRKKIVVSLVFLVALASLVLAEWLGRFDPDANFYLLPSRAWELGVGVLIALTSSRWQNTHRVLAQGLSMVGAALIGFSIFAFDANWQVPGLWGLVPVLGTALVIAFASPSNLIGKALAWRPLVVIGLISYSAYLWHQPLFAFYHLRHLEESNLGHILALSFLSLVLAYVSWRFVERPFRNRDKFHQKHVFSFAFGVSFLFIALGWWGHNSKGFPDRIPSDVLQAATYVADKPKKARKCVSRTLKYLEPPQKECTYNTPNPRIAIWGDSHAAAITETLADTLAIRGEGLLQITHTSCPPVPGFRRSDLPDDKCPDFNRQALDYLQNDTTIQTVIMLSRWSLYLEGTRFNNREGGVEPGRDFSSVALDKRIDNRNDDERLAHFGSSLKQTVKRLQKSGKKVLIVFPVPEVGWDTPRYVAKSLYYLGEQRAPVSTSLAVYENRSRHIRKILEGFSSSATLLFFEPVEYLCEDGRCFAEREGIPIYYDSNHLNSVGAKIIMPGLVSKL